MEPHLAAQYYSTQENKLRCNLPITHDIFSLSCISAFLFLSRQ